MKTLKDAFKFIVNLSSKTFYFLAALASLTGFFIIFMNDKDKIMWSFIFFNFLLLVFIGSTIYTILRLLNKSTLDFESKSTFIKYETLDGNRILYDVYKLIQCKRPILSEYDYNFKWSGTYKPNITSDLQAVIDVMDFNNPSNYDKAILKFKKPLIFNESCVIHFKADLDDADKQSGTFVSNRIIRPVDVIHYRILLRHKEDNPNAFIERKKIDAVTQNFNKIREIPFDKISKSYEFPLLNPELGYIYRISWKR